MSAGIHRKYEVKRTDGSSGKGGKHEHCAYFVLDLEHDDFAIPALRAYADACERAYPSLAADLRRIAESAGPACNCREAMCGHCKDNASETAARLMDSALRGAAAEVEGK